MDGWGRTMGLWHTNPDKRRPWSASRANTSPPRATSTSSSRAAGRRARTPPSLVSTLDAMGRTTMVDLGRRRDEIFRQQGITFAIADPDGASNQERPFPLDLVPRIIPAAEWEQIERGLAQRLRAMNAFIDDVYHGREIVRERIVPWELVLGSPQFRRAVHGVRPPGGIYCHVSGCDLVRDADGSWRVLEDNCRTPSGISYVLENRLAMTRLAPELFTGYRVRPVDDYPQLLLSALHEIAPAPGRDPTVVVWTPGPANSAYFEHSFLARQMGVELVEAGDLVVRDDICLHADHRGPGAGGRDLPPPRRRLHRPARVPTRLAARRSRPDPRLPRRDGGARERGRHRRRRRQGRLRLRPGDDPLLPRRGAAARQRAHLPAARSRAARVCARPTRHPGRQADGRVGRQGRLHRPARHRRGDRPPAPADRRRPGPLDRPGGGLALDDPDRDARAASSPRATSTCGRSPSTAPSCGSSRAASLALPWPRAR